MIKSMYCVRPTSISREFAAVAMAMKVSFIYRVNYES